MKDAHLLPEHLQCEPVDSSGVGGGTLLSLPHVAILAVGRQLGGEGEGRRGRGSRSRSVGQGQHSMNQVNDYPHLCVLHPPSLTFCLLKRKRLPGGGW